MLASPPHLSQHQRTPLTPPLSSSCSSHRSAKLKSSNPCNHRNQQYSIIGLTNATGTLVERYSYTAYGALGIYDASGTVRTTSTYANRYTYTGREYDADLNLYHFRARWYDPATGGFISRDPLGYVDGMSLYRGYFAVNGFDPFGLCTRGEKRGDIIQTVLVPATGKNPDFTNDMLNFLVLFAGLSEAVTPAGGGKARTLAELIAALVLQQVKGSNVQAAKTLAALKEFEILLSLTLGKAAIWTQIKCQECQCTTWLSGIRGELHFGWVTVETKWVQCDLSKTGWGKKNRPTGRNGWFNKDSLFFNLFHLDQLTDLKLDCEAQAIDKCL